MADCAVCGEGPGEYGFTCNYCDEEHCAEHRLPEQHDCSEFVVRDDQKVLDPGRGSAATRSGTVQPGRKHGASSASTSERSGPEPMSPDEIETVGKYPDSDDVGDRSPDVNLDGSIQNGTRTDSRSDEEDGGRVGRLLVLLLLAIVLVVATGLVYYTLLG